MTEAPTAGTIRVAWLSFWQAHAAPAPDLQFPGPGTITNVLNHPDLELVATWDEDPERGRRRSAGLGLPFVEDLDELLARSDIDGVLVAGPTRDHVKIIAKAAAAGKHVHSQKVLAPTLAQAREIVSAVDDAGVVLVTDMGWLYKSYVLRTKEIIDSGEIGTLVNVRLTHFHSMATFASTVDQMGYYADDDREFLSSAEGCGGALVDMCHPTYVTPYLCGGLPGSAYARFSSISGRGDVEDNAVVIFDYPDGPYAIVEASWTTPPMTTEIEVNGTLGSVLYRSVTGIDSQETFIVRSRDEPEFRDVERGFDGPSTLDLWVDCIRTGRRADENVARAIDLAILNEAAYASAASNASVAISEVHG